MTALTQHGVERALLTLKPWPAEWAWCRILNGVHVRRLDRVGEWFAVGLHDSCVLDLIDAAHAVRIGQVGYEHVCAGPVPCVVCRKRTRDPYWSVPAADFVCRGCLNVERELHAEHYAKLAAWVGAGPAAQPEPARALVRRAAAQQEFAL